MIETRSLSKSFGPNHAVREISLKIEPGETIVLQGPSGSGKSTLLRLLAGLELPDEGEVFIAGVEASRPGWAGEPHQRGIAMVFQRSALWPHMTVAQNLRFVIDDPGGNLAATEVDHLLAAVELDGYQARYPHQLSGGEARRVAIARALAGKPQRLLLDEPLTSLEPELKEILLAKLQAYLIESGASMLYVTHDREEAALVDGRLIKMSNGSLEA
jgi:iron(III) transport system ATP-binding protein